MWSRTISPVLICAPILRNAKRNESSGVWNKSRPHLPAPECLALENLERHPTDYLDKLVAATPHSRCFDIGHVWKEGLRPEKLLPLWLPDIRMCHQHGLEKRDHKSLHHMPAATLDAILHPMWDLHFSPLITLEVFSLDDFLNSHQAMLESHERYITKH